MKVMPKKHYRDSCIYKACVALGHPRNYIKPLAETMGLSRQAIANWVYGAQSVPLKRRQQISDMLADKAGEYLAVAWLLEHEVEIQGPISLSNTPESFHRYLPAARAYLLQHDIDLNSP